VTALLGRRTLIPIWIWADATTKAAKTTLSEMAAKSSAIFRRWQAHFELAFWNWSNTKISRKRARFSLRLRIESFRPVWRWCFFGADHIRMGYYETR